MTNGLKFSVETSLSHHSGHGRVESSIADSRELGLGLEVISEVHSAIARALNNPESFTRVRRNPIVRRVLTRRFPYAFFLLLELMQ